LTFYFYFNIDIDFDFYFDFDLRSWLPMLKAETATR
jgi:hypothetical protein